MPLLPLDLVLTVGSAAAVFVLGVVVWMRNSWATGSVLFGLAALSLSLWTASDWFVRLQITALPFQVVLWKILFNVTVCFGPAVAMHTALTFSRRRFQRDIALVYVIGIIASALLTAGLIASNTTLLQGGAALALLAYVGAVLFIASQLYPVIIETARGVLERRRASYATILLLIFVIAGCLQLIVGPFPIGLLMPTIAVGFLLVALAGFVRVSLFSVELATLEPFLLLLTTFGIVLLLRSRSIVEALVTFVGFIAVGLFGYFAVRAVGTEKHKRVLLEQANRELQVLESAKSDFVDMVAHQLRTPLGGIRASAAMLRDGDYGALPSKAANAAGLIEDAAMRLLSLAESFLSMSRVEVGMYRSTRAPTVVRTELTHVIEELRSSADAKKIALHAAVDPLVPDEVQIDTEALRNALFNLVDNAIKYTDAGEVYVTISIESNSLVLEVKDTGSGMTIEEQRDLFKKFHRGSVGRTHAMDGTGLGLYVVRRLIEVAGGRITVTSDGPGTGATFTAHLPIGDAAVV